MNEFELNGNQYRVGHINALTQFHVARRLAVILSEMAAAFQSGKNEDASLSAMANAISKLSDEDANYCLFSLLKAITRAQKNGMGWGPVCSANSLMYDDITMPVMLQLAWKSLQFNMSDFFLEMNLKLQGTQETTQG